MEIDSPLEKIYYHKENTKEESWIEAFGRKSYKL